MRRSVQWAGLLATAVLVAVLAWPEQADAGLPVVSTAMEEVRGDTPVPLVIVTDAPTGRLTLTIDDTEVRDERHPRTPMSMAISWGGGGGMAVRQGLGIRLVTRGRIDNALQVQTRETVAVIIEAADGTEVARATVHAHALPDATTIEW